MTIALPITLMMPPAPPLSAWKSIDLDSDIFTPSDAFRLEGPATADGVPVIFPIMQRTGRVSALMSGVIPVFTGFRATVEVASDGGDRTLTVEGADMAKVLVDCSPPIRFSRPAGATGAFAAEIGASLGVTVAATATLPRLSTTSFSATQTAWAMFEGWAKEAQAVVYCDPLGVVRIESLKPYYAKPPVDLLVSMPSGPSSQGNNLLSYRLRDDAGERYSHVIVKGQTSLRARQGNKTGLLQAPVIGLSVDPELTAMGIYRPLTIQDEDAKTIAQAQSKAIREHAIRRIQGIKIECEVPGFTTRTFSPWFVTDMVTVSIPADGIAGLYFVAGRRFMQDETRGSRTKLTLIEPGVL